jgi:outer membrane lipoprotein
VVFVVLAALGCAGGISQQARSQVTYHGSFSEMHRAVDQYNGNVVMFGGKVIETRSSQGGSEITVLHLPLDWRGRPEDSDRTEGRYLIRSGEFLDPAIYKKGALVTVVGRLVGSEVRSIGEFEYAYPVVEVIEVKPQPRGEGAFSGIHFGIGVGTSF